MPFCRCCKLSASSAGSASLLLCLKRLETHPIQTFQYPQRISISAISCASGFGSDIDLSVSSTDQSPLLQ